MASRVYKAGTIVSRTQSLLQAGVLETRPMWLDVVEMYPPLNPTHHNHTPEPGKPLVINFPKDSSIRDFHKVYEVTGGETISLFEEHSDRLTAAERFIEIRDHQFDKLGNSKTDSAKVAMETLRKQNIKINPREKMDDKEEEESPADKIIRFLNKLHREEKLNKK